MNDLPFRTLLYRYFFFGWLFREPRPEGNLFERAAARRYNRQQARWLPVYMLRWACVSFLCGGLGAMADGAVSHLFYAASALGLAMAVMSATAWVGLTRSEEPA